MTAKAQIYSKANCAYCVAAKNLLKSRGFDYEELFIDREPGRLEEMLGRTQRRTVPQVFVNGEHIGGFDELAEADRSGKLAAFAKADGESQ